MKKISEIKSIFPLKCKHDISMPLLYITFILSSISYLGYWMKAVWNGTYIYYKYYATDLNALSFLRYADDVMFIVLLLYLCVFYPQKKIFRWAIAWLLYGVFAMLLCQNASVMLLIGGVRSFIPAMAMLEWYLTYQDKCINCHAFKNCVHVIVIVQAISCLLLILTGDAYRTPGLLSNAGTLGIYCCGAALFYFTYYTHGYGMKWYEYYLFQIILFGIILAADSRSAMIVWMLIIMVSLMINLADRFKLSEKLRFLICCLGMAIGVPLFIGFTIWFSPRQNILELNLNGARMNIVRNFFQQDLIHVLFGGGLGYGTNTAVILGLNNVITDGTMNSLLYQFGLIGGGIFIVLLLYLMFRLTRHSGILFQLGFVCATVFISLNSNLFEMSGFVICFALSYYMICQKNRLTGSVF